MINFRNKKTVIGVIHLAPTADCTRLDSIENTLEKALADLRAFEDGGVDAIMIENNYDYPHKIDVGAETIALIGYITEKLKQKTNLPIGICVLWNDYKASLTLAKIYNCDFIRVPVFVDYVKTDFGEIKGNPEEVIEFRKKIHAENISLLVDLQVKHAELINQRPIEKAAIEAIEKGADGLIVTGKWTAHSPLLEDLKKVKEVAKNIPVIIGSGADKYNITSLLEFADSVIISTSLKEGEKKSPDEERNIKGYEAKVNLDKVKEFMECVKRAS